MAAPRDENPGFTPKEYQMNRYNTIWRLLLISNLALGAYLFAKARWKILSIEDRKAAKKGVKNIKDVKVEKPLPPPAVLKVKEPIPEDPQRELFQWILEEKRKLKPKDIAEKKQIDEEKAILKQFIHAQSLPSL